MSTSGVRAAATRCSGCHVFQWPGPGEGGAGRGGRLRGGKVLVVEGSLRRRGERREHTRQGAVCSERAALAANKHPEPAARANLRRKFREKGGLAERWNHARQTAVTNLTNITANDITCRRLSRGKGGSVLQGAASAAQGLENTLLTKEAGIALGDSRGGLADS